MLLFVRGPKEFYGYSGECYFCVFYLKEKKVIKKKFDVKVYSHFKVRYGNYGDKYLEDTYGTHTMNEFNCKKCSLVSLFDENSVRNVKENVYEFLIFDKNAMFRCCYDSMKMEVDKMRIENNYAQGLYHSMYHEFVKILCCVKKCVPNKLACCCLFVCVFVIHYNFCWICVLPDDVCL